MFSYAVYTLVLTVLSKKSCKNTRKSQLWTIKDVNSTTKQHKLKAKKFNPRTKLLTGSLNKFNLKKQKLKAD